MSKAWLALSVVGVVAVVGALFFFLKSQEQAKQDQLSAAAEWLMLRHERIPMAGGWSVTSVKPNANGVEVHLTVPEPQAATILRKPPVSRVAALRPGCPHPEEAIWTMLPSGMFISVAAQSATGKPLANAVCKGP